MTIDWFFVDAIVRAVGNFVMSIPMLLGGLLWVKIGKTTNSYHSKRIGYLGIAWAVYNIIAGSIYLYTTITGEFSILGIPAGFAYSISNTLANWFPFVFFGGTLGWFGISMKRNITKGWSK